MSRTLLQWPPYAKKVLTPDDVMDKQTQTSITNVSVFRVVSFNAFWKCLWLGNLAWDFLMVKFWSRDFWGVAGEGVCLRSWGFLGGLIFTPIRSFKTRQDMSLETRSAYLPPPPPPTHTHTHTHSPREASALVVGPVHTNGYSKVCVFVVIDRLVSTLPFWCVFDCPH